MQRRTFVTVLPLGLAAAHFPSMAADKPLVVGTDTANKPFVFLKDGQYDGFSYELWVQVAKEIGVPYQLRAMDFSALIPALQTKNVDVAFSSIFITAQRKEVVDFSDPYYLEGSGVLVRAGSPIKTLKDLAGQSVASVTGTAQVAWARDNLSAATQSQFPTVADSFLALRAERVDAVIYDYATLAYYAATDGRGKVGVLAERAGDVIPCGFAFPKGSPLVVRTNEALKTIRGDGRYQKLIQKWFGANAS